MREVLALVGLRQDEREVALRHVADEQDVEETVVGLGVGAHHHAAAQEPAVADHRVDHPAAARLVPDRHAHLPGLPPEEHRERRPVVRDLAAERLRGLVRALRDRPRDAGATDVREVRTRLVASPRAVGDDAGVDLAHRPLQRDVDCSIEVSWNIEGAHEVPTGPARNHRELDVFRADHAVDDLVHRAVSAHHDQARCAAADRLGSERSELAGPIRDQRVAVQSARRSAMGDLGPPLPRRTAGGCRVDEEDRARRASGRRDLPLRCRARSASCAPLPHGAPRPRSARTRPRRRCRSRSGDSLRGRRGARRA